MFVKNDFQGLRDFLRLIVWRLDLVEYSSIRMTLGRFAWQWSQVARSFDLIEAARWYRCAALVNFLHLPWVGQLATNEAQSWIPLELRDAFHLACRRRALLD